MYGAAKLQATRSGRTSQMCCWAAQSRVLRAVRCPRSHRRAAGTATRYSKVTIYDTSSKSVEGKLVLRTAVASAVSPFNLTTLPLPGG